jgi:hypothetical protein
MLLKKINYFIIVIFFDCSCAHIFGTSISLLKNNQSCVRPGLIVDSCYLMPQQNNEQKYVSWNLKKIDQDLLFSSNDHALLIFQYLILINILS